MSHSQSTMASVTYTPQADYKFPETSELYTTKNGITVERNSDTGVVTVSGTLSGVVNVAVPDAVSTHVHDFTYDADGATITATCTADDCPLTGSKAALTIVKPTLTTYGETGKSAAATLTGLEDFNTATGKTVAATEIEYYKATKNGDTYTKGDSLTSAPTSAGDYLAELTLSGVKTSEGEGKTFKANFTPTSTANYNSVSNLDVTVTVNKADATEAMKAASVAIQSTNGATATVSYTLPDGASFGTVTNGNTEYFTVSTSNGIVLTAAKGWAETDWATSSAKTFTVAVTGAANYNDYTLTVSVTPTYKATQTLTFEEATQTKTYGDADFTITAAHTTGDGAVTYAITSGDAATVNETTGEVHIVKAGSATVTATAAETSTYAEKTASYTLTVNKKDLTVNADAKSVIYGNPTPALTYTVTGLVGSDTLTGALSCAVNEKPNAGEYNIEQGTLAASDNYNLSFTGSKLKILKAAQSRPAGGEGYSIDASTHKITIAGDYEVINDEGKSVASDTTVTLNKTYSIRKAGNTNYTPSPYTDFTVASVAVTATASPEEGGSITGTGSYMVGASVELKATPNSGYQFKEWQNESGITIGTSGTYTFKAAKNTSITAVFMQTEKTIVQIPTATNKTFNDAEQTGVTATANCNVSGGTQKNAGSYTATATLTNTTDYVWSDGTSAPKSIAWSINKASQPRPSVTVDGTTATIAAAGNGKVEYKLASETAYTGVDTLSITGLTTNSTYHVRYAGNDNYLPSSATIVKVGNPYVAPAVKTNAVSGLSATSATISGTATNGKYAETHIITISTGASTQATSFTVLEGNGTLEAVVDIKTADTPKVAADGIRDTITSEEATLIQNGELSVKTALDVEKKTSGSAIGASQIAAEAGSNKTVDLFLDLSLIKTTSELDGTGEVVGVMEEDIGAKNDVVLQIAIPYADAAKEGLEVYRYHGNTASTLKSLTAKPSDGFVDGTFFADTANKYLFIYAKDFSTYAVGYTTPAAPYSSSTTYTIEVSGNTDNGKVTLSKTKAQSGEKITVTVKPDEGYAVGTVTDTDASGKSVSVTKTSDTTYTFTMPSSKVTVNATFTNGACPQDATCPVSKFTDADVKAWYHDGVHWVLENSVMEGVGSNKFNPNGDTSRAMVVTMLWRMEGSPAYVGMSEFIDVDNEQWYGQAVRWASAEGIVEGYTQNGNKVFNPDGAVTREQLATILYRYAQYKKQDVSVGGDTNILSYDDAFSVSTWAMAAMQWACGSGIINGIGSNLAPAGKARATTPTSTGASHVERSCCNERLQAGRYYMDGFQSAGRTASGDGRQQLSLQRYRRTRDGLSHHKHENPSGDSSSASRQHSHNGMCLVRPRTFRRPSGAQR